MYNKKIVIAGGTGFVGNYLTKQFTQNGYEVKIISRGANFIQWKNVEEIVEALNGAEMLINLAGKSVDCRYNEKNKQEILSSRVDTTIALGKAMLQCSNPPKIWINSSTATIYRYSDDKPMTEANGEIGTGFSVNIAKQWEQSFFDFKLPNTRQIALRISIVLGKNGGVIKPMMNLVRFGLGGKQGNGKQMFSWIHIEDLYQIILHLQSNEKLVGAFNCATPNPITNSVLMQTFRQVMNIKFGLPSPKFLLEIGARIIKTETELILKSRWVLPEKILQTGFVFKYPTIDKALENIIKE
jgi:uncharacterized protein